MSNETGTPETQPQKPGVSKRTLVLVIVGAVLIAAVGISLGVWFTQRNVPSGGKKYEMEDNVILPGEDQDMQDMLDEMRKQVDEGQINVVMRQAAIFENGTAEGELYVMNSTQNRYPFFIQIALPAATETEEEKIIYESGLIPLGAKLTKIKLDQPLEKGEYTTTMYYTLVDEETQEEMGTTGVEFMVYVLN